MKIKCTKEEDKSKDGFIKMEDNLYEKNETLRIVGMYSFLFYLVACAVAIFVTREGYISNCFAIILCVIGFIIAATAIIIAAVKVSMQTKKVVIGQKKYKVTVVEESEQNGINRYVCDVRHL